MTHIFQFLLSISLFDNPIMENNIIIHVTHSIYIVPAQHFHTAALLVVPVAEPSAIKPSPMEPAPSLGSEDTLSTFKIRAQSF